MLTHGIPRRSWIIGLCALLSSAAMAVQPLVIAAEDDWYPYSASNDGEAVGFAVDVVREAFLAAGQPVRFEVMPYARCMKLVKAGKQLGCFDTSKDASLSKDYLWHQRPLFRARIMIFGPPGKGTRPVRVQDLNGKRVGLTNGYTYSDAIDQNPQVNKDWSLRDIDSLRKLAAGRVDYALVFEQVAAWLLAQDETDLRQRVTAQGEVKTMELFLSFSKTYPDAPHWVKVFETGLQRIHQNGRYQQLEQQWFKSASVPPAGR